MKYLGIYTSIKEAVNNFYAWLNKADTFVESQPYETAQMWGMIGVVAVILFLIFLAWLVSLMERTPRERGEE